MLEQDIEGTFYAVEATETAYHNIYGQYCIQDFFMTNNTKKTFPLPNS